MRVAEPSRRQHLPPARSAVAPSRWLWWQSGHRQCLASPHLPPASAKSLPRALPRLYPARAPSSLTMATNGKGWAGIFEWFGNVIPKSFCLGGVCVSETEKTSQVGFFGGLFGFYFFPVSTVPQQDQNWAPAGSGVTDSLVHAVKAGILACGTRWLRDFVFNSVISCTLKLLI